MSEQALVRARTVHHIRIDSGRPYTQFRTDYETVVPSFDRLEAIGVASLRLNPRARSVSYIHVHRRPSAYSR